jgi:small subunit ribosomal protein S9
MATNTSAPAAQKKPRKAKQNIAVTTGKRKRSIARAVVSKGPGHWTYNGMAFSAIADPLVRQIASEPLSFLEDPSAVDVRVTVRGGGVYGQAQAARTALAKGIAAYTQDEALEKRMLVYDRSLLIDDPRRVEPKKFKGPKARARFTKSYR